MLQVSPCTCSRTIFAPSCQPIVGLMMSMIVDCHHLATRGFERRQKLSHARAERVDKEGSRRALVTSRQNVKVTIPAGLLLLGNNSKNRTAREPPETLSLSVEEEPAEIARTTSNTSGNILWSHDVLPGGTINSGTLFRGRSLGENMLRARPHGLLSFQFAWVSPAI